MNHAAFENCRWWPADYHIASLRILGPFTLASFWLLPKSGKSRSWPLEFHFHCFSFELLFYWIVVIFQSRPWNAGPHPEVEWFGRSFCTSYLSFNSYYQCGWFHSCFFGNFGSFSHFGSFAGSEVMKNICWNSFYIRQGLRHRDFCHGP